MAGLAVKNQALSRWYTFPVVGAAVLRQIVRFARIAFGGTTHWGR